MNVLTNAVEHCISIKDRVQPDIDFSLYSTSGMLVIRCSNTIISPPVILGDKIVSTKEDDGEFHGKGLSSIRLTARRYNGIMRLHAKDGRFEIAVSMENRSATHDRFSAHSS